MTSRHSLPFPGVTLRVAGLILLAAGAAMIRFLSRIAALPPRHAASPAELALATVGFLGLSAGAVLIVLGGHVLDRIAVSDRWTPYR